MLTSKKGPVHIREDMMPFTVNIIYPSDVEGLLTLIEYEEGEGEKIKKIVVVTARSVRDIAAARNITSPEEALKMLLGNPVVVGIGEDGRHRVRAIVENPPKEDHKQQE